MSNSIHKGSIAVLKIRYSLLYSILTFFCGFIGIFNVYTSLFIFIILVLSYVFIIIYYCPENYRRKSYHISNQLITINYGVFFFKSISVNLNKLQYIELIQSPSQKMFSTCSLIFHTSGSKTVLSNIELSAGSKIKSKLTRRIVNEI